MAVRLGTEFKAVYANLGNMASLKTTDKTAIVAAINEVVDTVTAAQTTLNDYATRLTTVEGKASTNSTGLATAKTNITNLQTTLSTVQTTVEELQDQIASSTNIDDTKASTTTTYSSSKVESVVTAAKQAVKDDLLGGAGAAYDTLKELADLITENQTAIDALEAVAAGHVKYDAAQDLTAEQKTQARSNIGAADASEVSGYGTRLTAVETKANTNATDIANLTAAVGDTTVDLVAAFEGALNDTGA